MFVLPHPLRACAAVALGVSVSPPALAVEPPLLVEHRLAAQRQPNGVSVRAGALHFEIEERFAPFQLSAVPLPIGLGEIGRRPVPALAAEVGRRVDTGTLDKAAGHKSETKLLVLFPVPIRGQRREAAKARFAFAQLAFC